MDIVLLGAPGSGKGTQAVFLAAELNVTHVASGDLFREHLHNRTPLGRRAEGFMSAGALVPDEITIAMLRERLERGTQREAFFSTDFQNHGAGNRAQRDDGVRQSPDRWRPVRRSPMKSDRSTLRPTDLPEMSDPFHRSSNPFRT